MAVIGLGEKVLVQVCVIVRNVERTAQNYADILGFDVPDVIQITREHDHTHALYYGNPMDARAKIICFEIGKIQYELLQPLDEGSVWMDFLQKHGEGVHHIAFFVPKTDVAAESFAEHSYHITQQGLFTGQTGMYSYLDTERDLGTVIELLEHFGGGPVLAGPPFPAEKGIGTDIVCQVGLMVNDIERTAQRYADVLGVPLPPILTTAGYDVSKTMYKGAPSDATAKLAFFDFGQLQLELIEPDEQPSVWRDYLNEHGESVHHIAFMVQDTENVVKYLAEYGIAVLQQGLYSDGTGVYTYVDSAPQLGVMLELLQNF